MRITLLVTSLLLAFATGWLGHGLYVAHTSPSVEERSVVLEGQIRKIAQLATVERRYSELFNHKEVGYLDLPMFNKSVILRANARVVMGFDLEGIRIEADEGTRTLTIYDWPEPEELAFEMQTSYFDFNQGWFNGFDTKELNDVSKRLELRLREKIDPAPLRIACYEQADDLLGVIRDQLALASWQLKVADWPIEAVEETPNSEVTR